MNIPLSYSKYNSFLGCPIKYTHQYLFKTVVEEDITYPLVLGQLVHLFIKIFNDNIYTKKQIREIKDNIDVLYELTDLSYPALNENSCEIKKINIKTNVEKVIDFINNNEVVFFHAIKLFNIYLEKFFPKINQCSDYLSETTFHNIVTLNNKLKVCYYGSIDLLFFDKDHNKLKYLFVSDFKTGKALYDYYFEQLFFYVYNIIEYNENESKNIVNNTDNIEILNYLKRELNSIGTNNIHLLLFNVKAGRTEKKILSDCLSEYDKFINNLKKNTSEDLFYLHENKELLNVNDIYNKYKESRKFLPAEVCKTNELSFTCSYCKFKEQCDFRIKKQ